MFWESRRGYIAKENSYKNHQNTNCCFGDDMQMCKVGERGSHGEMTLSLPLSAISCIVYTVQSNFTIHKQDVHVSHIVTRIVYLYNNKVQYQ